LLLDANNAIVWAEKRDRRQLGCRLYVCGGVDSLRGGEGSKEQKLLFELVGSLPARHYWKCDGAPSCLKAGEFKVMAMAALTGRRSRIPVASRMRQA
jgi:hypothetical protein